MRRLSLKHGRQQSRSDEKQSTGGEFHFSGLIDTYVRRVRGHGIGDRVNGRRDSTKIKN